MANAKFPACTVENLQEPPSRPSAPSFRKNLRQYWREHTVHVAVGATAGCLLTVGHHWAGAAVIATVWVRQSLEFQKRRDTPGIDLSYHLGGLIGGIMVGLLAMAPLP